MLNDVYHNPTQIYFGRGMEEKAGEIVRRFGTRALFVYGGGSIFRNGLYEKTAGALRAAGVQFETLGGVQPNPRSGLVRRGIGMCREKEIGVILAAGGGSVIDTAKAIAIGTPHGGDFLDFFRGKAAPEQALPVVTILTVPGAGSESSPAAVVTDEESGSKLACGSPLLFPAASILNPEYTCTLTANQTACGVADAMSHILERYFTNTPNVDCTDRLAEALLRTLVEYAPLAIAEPGNYDYRAEIMWASKLAHDNTAGFGRKQDWATHKIAHAIGAHYDLPHGAILAVLFPAWMEAAMPHGMQRLARLGERVFGIEGASAETRARETIEAFRSFFRTLGMASTLRELGADGRPQFRSFAEWCVADMQSGTIGNFVRLAPDDIVRILDSASEGAS